LIHFRELSPAEVPVLFPRTEEERKIVSFPFQFKRSHFFATIQDQVVGRISVNLSQKDPTRGYFGFFHVDPSLDSNGEECAQGLLALAEDWLCSNGVTQVIGPVNYSTLFEYRFGLGRSGNNGQIPEFSWEPADRPEYTRWVLNKGYALLEEYHSRAFRDPALVLGVSEKRYKEALEVGFKTRPIQFSGVGSPDLEALYRINSKSFEDSFLSEPFDFAAYATLNVPKYVSLLSEFSFFILSPKGEEIGYFFLFPDQEYLVWKTIAILPEYQKAGLAGFGIHHALEIAHQKGISKVIAALIRRGAPSEALLTKAESLLIWEHRYGLFRKKIP
jgi:GNAT superfamily N-acetyltransferase